MDGQLLRLTNTNNIESIGYDSRTIFQLYYQCYAGHLADVLAGAKLGHGPQLGREQLATMGGLGRVHRVREEPGVSYYSYVYVVMSHPTQLMVSITTTPSTVVGRYGMLLQHDNSEHICTETPI